MELYLEKTDEELIERLRQGESEVTDYLLEKYKNLVRKKVQALFLIGGDRDDLIQEGMIGLYKAIRDYTPNRDSSFFHFADICIGRQLYTAIEASQRKKHAPLNAYISLSHGSGEGEYSELEGTMLTQEDTNPEQILLHQEEVEQLGHKMNEVLSTMEKEVVIYYLQGMDYKTIAEKMGKEPKSIDNALQRIKKKLIEK